jgi:hypothetical protein
VNVPECYICRVSMEEGHVLDQDRNAALARVRWTEGQPEKTFFGGHRAKGRRQIDTITYRCPRCGWLLWFAPEPSS